MRSEAPNRHGFGQKYKQPTEQSTQCLSGSLMIHFQMQSNKKHAKLCNIAGDTMPFLRLIVQK